MPQATVTDTGATLDIGRTSGFIIQNLGPDIVYFGFSPGVSDADGIELQVNEAYDTTTPATRGGKVYVVAAAAGSSDVRYERL